MQPRHHTSGIWRGYSSLSGYTDSSPLPGNARLLHTTRGMPDSHRQPGLWALTRPGYTAPWRGWWGIAGMVPWRCWRGIAGMVPWWYTAPWGTRHPGVYGTLGYTAPWGIRHPRRC